MRFGLVTNHVFDGCYHDADLLIKPRPVYSEIHQIELIDQMLGLGQSLLSSSFGAWVRQKDELLRLDLLK